MPKTWLSPSYRRENGGLEKSANSSKPLKSGEPGNELRNDPWPLLFTAPHSGHTRLGPSGLTSSLLGLTRCCPALTLRKYFLPLNSSLLCFLEDTVKWPLFPALELQSELNLHSNYKINLLNFIKVCNLIERIQNFCASDVFYNY